MAESTWTQRLRTFLERRRGEFVRRLRRDPADPARRWVRRRWLSLLALGAGISATITFDVWLATCGFEGCPTAADIRHYRPPEGSRVLDRSGRLVGRLTYVKRINVSLGRIPRSVREAFIATEDRRFYQHDGLDWRAAARAAVRNVGAMGVREGFSTITMQAARNAFTPRLITERSLHRKLLEMRLARLLERSLTKDQILELYLNVIYLGNGTYGVEAASRDLFGKSIADVTLPEAAMLAALPKGPSVYTPRRDAARARARRNLVLALMAQQRYITRERAAAAAAQPVRVSDEAWQPPQHDSYAIAPVRALVDSLLGPDAFDNGDITVYTTLDGRAQRAAERAVRVHAAEIDAEAAGRRGRRGPEVEGALIALDPATGDIRALVGGRRNDPGGFDRALDARRQPGSAFKPFVYAAALTRGYTPATIVDDTPVEVEMAGRIWTPANYGDDYAGPITMRHALMRSSNAAAVRFSRAVGERAVVQRARDNGITSPLRPVPSVALGALEVTPIELATAYAPFANGGSRVHPRLVRRIEGADGTLLWSDEITPPVRVMDPRDVFQLTSMLRSVVDAGTGRAVRDWGARGPIAGKTGTTNDGTDVWFAGYTPDLVAVIWFGYDAPRTLAGDASGGRLAAPAWADFYINGWHAADERAWQPPPGLVSRVIDADNGLLANQWCPLTQREWFKAGTEPTEYCRDHTEPVDSIGDWIGEKVAAALKKIFRF